MKKNYNRRYLKKDNTISVYSFNQEIKHIDPEIKKLKQDIRPFINKMSKDNLNKLLGEFGLLGGFLILYVIYKIFKNIKKYDILF